MFLTEPGLGKRFGSGQRTPRSLPCTNNLFYHKTTDKDIRACIVADPTQQMDLLPQFSSGDVVSVLWRSGIKDLKKVNKAANNKQHKNNHHNTVYHNPDTQTKNTTGNNTIAPNDHQRDVDVDRRQTHTLTNATNSAHSPTAKRSRTLHSSNIRDRLSQSPEAGSLEVTTGNDTGASIQTGCDSRARTHTHQKHTSRKLHGNSPNRDHSNFDFHGNDVRDIVNELDSDNDNPDHNEQNDAAVAPGDDHVIICCVYWDCKLEKQFPKELLSVLEHAQDKNIPILVWGDLNAHSEV